eukprot:NODE_579_length_6479_cov_0.371160.p4 type:complete len:183 gc:universal NODE_579_length_6479_cov_0.371160:637-89(-)
MSSRQKRLEARNLRKLRHRFEHTINIDLPRRLKKILDEFNYQNSDTSALQTPVISLSRLIDTAEQLPSHGFNNALYVQLNRVRNSRVLETTNDTQINILTLFDDLAGEMRSHMQDVHQLNMMGLNCIKANTSHIEDRCCICYSNYLLKDEIFQLHCKHLFHKQCIIPWIEEHYNCPLCRKSL